MSENRGSNQLYQLQCGQSIAQPCWDSHKGQGDQWSCSRKEFLLAESLEVAIMMDG